MALEQRYTKQAKTAYPTEPQREPNAILRAQKRQPRRRRPPKSVDLERLLASLKEN